jgi:hypothetical protein
MPWVPSRARLILLAVDSALADSVQYCFSMTISLIVKLASIIVFTPIFLIPFVPMIDGRPLLLKLMTAVLSCS